MVLKKIMHYFCGRSLEKVTAKTNALIRDVEQREKAAVGRLRAKANEYRAEAIAYKKKRDAELQDFVQFFNEQVGRAEVYVPHLGDFQDKMFVCFDSWMNTSIAEQQIQLLSDRISTKYKMLDFVTALKVAMNKLTQRNERNEWRHMTKERSIPVESAFIERTVRQVSISQKNNSESIRHELSRLKSHSIALQTEINELRHERDQLITSSSELMEKHRANKADLQAQYGKCCEIFGEIKDKFSDRFGSASTQNSLADAWIAGIQGGVTLQKLISTHKGTAEIQQEAHDAFNEISEEFHAIRARIDESHKSGDFGTFVNDKATRDRLYLERQRTGEKRREISTARKVIYARGNELKEMLSKFDSLQPDESIRRIVEIFRMGKDFDVHRAIGVRTREERRKHYELKNQNRHVTP